MPKENWSIPRGPRLQDSYEPESVAVFRMGLVMTKTTKLVKNARRCKQCESPLANLTKSNYCNHCQENAREEIRKKEARAPMKAAEVYGKKTLSKRIKGEAINLLTSRRKRRSSKL